MSSTSAAGLLLISIVITMLVRRWRRASPAMRKLAWPVIAAGIAALGAIGLLVVSNEISASASDALQPLFFVAFAAVPVSFLFGVLRTRLARSSVSELVVALDAGEPLRGALAGALGDPDLDVVYWLDWRRGLGGAGWVDLQGQSVQEPTPDDRRAVKLVQRDGVRVAAIVYDRGLDAEPEHLEAVTAAAALALQNDRLQAELRAEVGFISTVTNTAPSLLVNIGTDGRVRSINVAALDAAGLDDDERARGEHFWNLFIEPGERDGMIARFHALAPDYPAGEYENTFTNARGEVRTIYWRAAPVKDAAGRVVSIVSGGLDITERRKRELELERERDATTTALETIPSIAVLIDRDGTIRDRDVDNPRVGANRAFRQALGWRDHELVGTRFLDLVVDDDGTAAAAIATAGAGAASEEVESELRCADGSVRAFLWTAVPVADVTGRTEALVLVSGIEITERRRLEVEKERERTFLNAIANNAPSMLCLIDEEGRLTQGGANIAFERTLGYEPADVGGQVLWEHLVDPAETDEVRTLVEAVSAGAPAKEHDNTWVARDGRRLSVAWTCTPLPEIDERRLFLITGVDITERKRTAEDLHASRARLVRAEDRARRVLERNLHDGAQQRLVALSIALRLVESKLASDPTAATELLTGAREELTQALAELRELARGIHPAVLTDRGLRPALEMLGIADSRAGRGRRPRRALRCRDGGRRLLRDRGDADERRQVRAGVLRPRRGGPVERLPERARLGRRHRWCRPDGRLRPARAGRPRRRPRRDARDREPARWRHGHPRRDPAGRGDSRNTLRPVNALPTGTVTFLFADVEGSTALQGNAAAVYPDAIVQLRSMLRETVSSSGGAESDAVGDEYVAAFGEAPGAAGAALEIQRRLRDTEWPGGIRVRIRVGLHTGTPTLGDEGYTGIDIVRASRIANAGHGGQILVSADTLGALDDMPSRDLGEFRLEGLAHPERIHQLLADDLPRDFPPLRNTISTLGAGVTVALADDTVLLREGIARLLSDSGFEVVAQSGNPDDLLRHVAMHKPSVAIVDIRMPPTHTDEGIEAAREIRERFPATSVLVLSQYVEAAYAMDLFASSTEGLGYLLKDRVADVEEFANAVRRVSEGRIRARPGRRRRAPRPKSRARPARAAHPTRARGPRADGRRTLQPGDRRPPLRHAPRDREARDEHLREARPAGDDGRPPPRAGGPGLPQRLTRQRCG